MKTFLLIALAFAPGIFLVATTCAAAQLSKIGNRKSEIVNRFAGLIHSSPANGEGRAVAGSKVSCASNFSAALAGGDVRRQLTKKL